MPAIIYLKHAPDWAIPVHHHIYIYIYINTPLIWRFRLPYTFNTPDQWSSNTPPLGASGSSYIFKHAPHLAIPAIIYLKHAPPPWGDSGLSYIFKHAPHLAIPAIIYLKHAPRLGDSGSSYIYMYIYIYLFIYSFKHAPHLAIPAIIHPQHARPVGFIIYLEHAP